MNGPYRTNARSVFSTQHLRRLAKWKRFWRRVKKSSTNLFLTGSKVVAVFVALFVIVKTIIFVGKNCGCH